MVEFHRSNDRVASRESASGFANVVGARLANDAMSASQLVLLARLRNARSSSEIASAIRGMRFDDVVEVLASEQRDGAMRIEQLEREVAGLRAVQQPPDPTGAHPYRSTMPGEAPSSPVAASSTSERVKGRPCALRRVYGALWRRWLLVPTAAIAIVGWVRGGWEVALVLGAVALTVGGLAMLDAAFRVRGAVR